MKINEQDIVLLTNRPSADPDVLRLLAFASVALRKIEVKCGESDAAVHCGAHGLMIISDEANDMPQLREGSLMHSAVRSVPWVVQRRTGFEGVLPLALTFDIKRPALTKLCGKSDSSGSLRPISCGNRHRHPPLVQFCDDERGSSVLVAIQTLQ